MCPPNKNEDQNDYVEPVNKVQSNLSDSTKIGLFMDEALSKTKFGLFNYILIFVGGLILNAVIMETSGILFVLPVSECDLNLTASDKGVLAAIPFVGIICSSHLWGFLADTKGRRRIIQPTLFTAFLLSVVSSFVQNFYLFATLRFLNGFFISGGSATIYAFLGEFHDNKNRSRALMGSSIIYGISLILLPLIAWAVISRAWEFDLPLIDIAYKPWRLFLVVCSLPGFFSFLIMSYLPESPKFVLGQGNQAEAYQILQKINRLNNGKTAALEQFDIHEEPESIENRQRIEECKNARLAFLSCVWVQTAPLFKPPYLSSTLLICFIQFCIYTTTNGFFMFFVEILNKMAVNSDDFTNYRAMMCDIINMKPNLNDTMSAIDNTACTTTLEFQTLMQSLILEILYAVLFFVYGLLINRVGKFLILFVSLVGPGICGIVCMLTDIPLLQISAFIALMLAGDSPIVISAATVEVYPTSLRAMAVCISLMFGSLGTVVGANIDREPWNKLLSFLHTADFNKINIFGVH